LQTRIIFKKTYDFFIFSNLFISLGAWVMSLHTLQLFHITNHNTDLTLFLFFSTLASYNLHWLLTDPKTERTRPRWQWLRANKNIHLSVFLMALVPSVFFLVQLMDFWALFVPLFVLTFIYTSPKLPFRSLQSFGQYNIGKTFVLTAVWVYATTLLPLLMHSDQWKTTYTFFCLYRFCLIFSICILFDLKDRRHDRSNGIKSVVTWLPTNKLKTVFTIFIAVSFIASLAQFIGSGNWVEFAFSILPILLTYKFFEKSLLSTDSYFYYFILDGMMILPSILHFFFIFAGSL
jgi:4-hydroxybenzoate polyprenyltransferase